MSGLTAPDADLAVAFEAFFRQACGRAPYPFQRRLALEGAPEVLRVPTGAGKTAAATLGWLFRRRMHPDPEVRGGTPHWLAFVLPMRVLVEQAAGVIGGWLAALGLEGEVGLHVVMGGEARRESAWRTEPERDAIFVGTLDMLLSRALNRGYGESRFAWPIDFGLFNSGVHWVFDEVQLMGPALPTSCQLDAFRRQFGTASPCASMWMSATLDEAGLQTVDHPDVGRVVALSAEDRTGALGHRLAATKLVRRVVAGEDPRAYARSLADQLLAAHRPGTRSIAVLNTVSRARDVHAELRQRGAVDLVLLHSRFRPGDRARHTQRALSAVDPQGPGRIVVSTQIIEAGVDISADTMLTEAAPWPSIVQRAGRCNRDGEADYAQLLWVAPPQAKPYEDADVAACVSALEDLEGCGVTPESLGTRAVAVKDVVHPVLRRRDLVGIFDTAPDLSGNDIDVGRFLRAGNDLDVLVAWRALLPDGPNDREPQPTRAELCPVPISDMRADLKSPHPRHAWRFDHLAESWATCSPRDLRPGLVLLLDASEGGYEATSGWSPASRTAVELVQQEEPSAVTTADEGVGADPATFASGHWVTLRQHLTDVEVAVRELIQAVAAPGLSRDQLEAAALAGRLHDWGKVHPVFQATLVASARTSEERRQAETAGPWAKSPHRGPHHRRRHFRHELASALALDEGLDHVLAGAPERDLVCYLIGAHHGRVRLCIRSLPDETTAPAGARAALGVWDGDRLPVLETDVGVLPATTLDLSVMELGEGPGGRPSWTGRALRLRDRADLGPFRLGFLEALLRLADWRASAREEV